jgi:TctA family transporter
MRTTLITAKQNNIENILIPMFGGLTGGIHPKNISKMMRYAYDQVQEPPEKITWEYIRKLK